MKITRIHFLKHHMLLLFSAVGAGLFIYCQVTPACGAQPVATSTTQPRSVSIIHPAAVQRTEPFIFNAKLEPLQQASIYARANGYIEEQHVDIGSMVKKGDLLARLSSPELEEMIVQAEQEVIRQQAEVVLAQKMYERMAALVDTGAVSVSTVDQREAEKDVAKARLNTLKAKLEQLRSEFSYTKIHAPFAGIITQRHVNQGDRISVNDNTPMYELVQSDPLRVVIHIPQTLLYAVDITAEASLYVQEKTGKPLTVSFQRQAHAIHQATGTLRVEYALHNSDLSLPVGLTGRINIPAAHNVSSLTIPTNALLTKNGKTAVMTLNEKNEVETRPVTTGARKSANIEITHGLSADDRIILNPNALIREGDTVLVSKTS